MVALKIRLPLQKNSLYCNVIEMQFVNTRSESVSTSNNDIHRSIQNQPPNPVKIKKEPDKGNSSKNQIKINEIARTSTTKTNETDGEMSREEDTLSSIEVVDISKESDDEEESTHRLEENKKTES